MYLDQRITARNLLQAIARVNRVHDENKTCGFIVDYVGVGSHLREALSNYDEREQKEISETLEDEAALLTDLRQKHQQVKEHLVGVAIHDPNDYDAYHNYFYDEEARFEFLLRFRDFARALDAAYPRKEALEYVGDFKHFTEINVMCHSLSV